MLKWKRLKVQTAELRDGRLLFAEKYQESTVKALLALRQPVSPALAEAIRDAYLAGWRQSRQARGLDEF